MRTVSLLSLAALWTVCALGSGCASLNWKWKNNQEVDDKLSSQLSFARLTERHGQPKQARAVYEAILRDNPNQPVAHHRLAILAASEPDFARAESHFQQALAAGEPNTELLRDYGYLLYMQDRLPEAEQVTRQALERDPLNKAAHNNLGLIIGEQGRFPEAMEAFRKAGSEAECHANLAYVHTIMGNLPLAEQHYHQALEIDPNLKKAAEGLVQLSQFRQQQRATAEREKMVASRTPGQPQPPLLDSTHQSEHALIDAIQEGPTRVTPNHPSYSTQPLSPTSIRHGAQGAPTVSLPPGDPQRLASPSSVATRPLRGTPVAPPNPASQFGARADQRMSGPSHFTQGSQPMSSPSALSTRQGNGLPPSTVMPASFNQPAPSRGFQTMPPAPAPSGMRSAAATQPAGRGIMGPTSHITPPGAESSAPAWNQSTPWQAPSWTAPAQPQR